MMEAISEVKNVKIVFDMNMTKYITLSDNDLVRILNFFMTLIK